MKLQHGFSLIELMISVAIIGILSGIAIPQYQDYVIRTYRSEGMTQLLDIMRSQENYYSNSYTYASDLAELAGMSTVYITPNKRYSITAGACMGGLDLTQCVKLTAVALDGQISDGALTLDSRGNKTHKGVNGWIK